MAAARHPSPLPLRVAAWLAGAWLGVALPASGQTAPPPVDVRSHGALCNGKTDDVAAFRRAIDAARRAGAAVSVPAATCAYGDVIRLDGVSLVGQGPSSVLHALNWSRQALFVYGNGAQVRRLRFTGVAAPSRQAHWEATRITLFGATNWLIDEVSIDSAAAAGIQTAQAARDGRIARSQVRNTLSDGIHLTDRAARIVLEDNRIENTGDDGIGIVSLQSDGGPVEAITARRNVVLGNRWGRQISVVGGSQVLLEQNHLAHNLSGWACLYFAQEAGYATLGVRNVVAQRNTLVNCGSRSTGHGAVMLYSDGQDLNVGVTIRRNDVQQNGQPGLVVFSAYNRSVVLDSNRVTGAVPALRVESAGVTVVPYTSGPVGAEIKP